MLHSSTDTSCSGSSGVCAHGPLYHQPLRDGGRCFRRWSLCAGASCAARCFRWQWGWWFLWHSWQETSPVLHLSFSPHSTTLAEEQNTLGPHSGRSATDKERYISVHVQCFTFLLLKDDHQLSLLEAQLIRILRHVGLGGFILRQTWNTSTDPDVFQDSDLCVLKLTPLLLIVIESGWPLPKWPKHC